MQPYMHGNLAVREERQQETGYRIKKKVVRRKVGIPAREKLLYLLLVMLSVVVAGSVIWKHAQIYEINTRIQQVEREIQQLEKENQSLELEVRRLKDPERMLELGKQMGFHPVGENAVSQIVPAPESGTEILSAERLVEREPRVAYRN